MIEILVWVGVVVVCLISWALLAYEDRLKK
jgi:hypothetical protein